MTIDNRNKETDVYYKVDETYGIVGTKNVVTFPDSIEVTVLTSDEDIALAKASIEESEEKSETVNF